MNAQVSLSAESVEAIAGRVTELLRGEPTGPGLVDAAELARRFNVTRAYVYDHATELGAVRLGTGPKARLRFNPERVVEALAPRAFTPPAPTPSRRRPQSRAASAELLPIGRRR